MSPPVTGQKPVQDSGVQDSEAQALAPDTEEVQEHAQDMEEVQGHAQALAQDIISFALRGTDAYYYFKILLRRVFKITFSNFVQ